MAEITFSGLGSGMDYSTWIEALVEARGSSIKTYENKIAVLETKQEALDTIKSSCNVLNLSLSKMNDARWGGELDIFSSHLVKSSNQSCVTANVTNMADIQSISVYVEQLATATTAQNKESIVKKVDEETVFTSLTNKSAKAGSFSIYVDNEKIKIDIEEEDTFAEIKEKLEESGKLSVELEDGKLKISADGKINIGANSDTSNFASVMNLVSSGENTVESSKDVFNISLKSKLVGEETCFTQPITEGTFIIGDEEFTIDENTTLSSLISTINSSTKAGVIANFDYNTGKFTLTSKTDGATNINIEAGTSNFTDVVGLTENGKLKDGSQTLGKNAKLIVNGTEITSFSNTVTSEVTGLNGVTLNLHKEMEEEKETAKIDVTQDTDKIVSSITELFNNMNTVLEQITTATSEDGALLYESQLVSLKNNLKTMTISSIETSSGNLTLTQFGISTGKPGLSVDNSANTIVIDENALRSALETNPEQVKELLVGNGKSEGVITKLANIIDSSLSYETGFFSSKTNSYSSEMKLYEEKITKKNEQLENYKASLERQFQSMDASISSLQSQYSNLLSMI